jgi:hypothetical protein
MKMASQGDSPENFRDLFILADCDTDKSKDAAWKLVCRLYDQKGKLKEDHVDLNKLRVRLATLRDEDLVSLHVSVSSHKPRKAEDLVSLHASVSSHKARKAEDLVSLRAFRGM